MRITASGFQDGETIPVKYTCDGGNVSPAFDIADVPEYTRSLALVVEDPDSPAGVWDHWVVWNIPANIEHIPEDTLPEGAMEGKNDFGATRYGGPCPKEGEHRYFFRLYALSKILDIPRGTIKELLEAEMAGHIIEKAELYGRYERI